jgi:intracellular sulfur oxidation DsrE/DsrF family protein
MQESQKFQSRKKFLLWGAAALSSVSVLRFFKAPKKREKTETVKMLTQDGRLVEVTVSAITSKKKKITNRELQNWIKKDKV